ncbi:Hermansky-Pudlak syndrome 3 protein-like [Limulus polyphemus]|uniref:Hermansky-Pudlak syndrome 3 protein-like n=1 Tax=Limulus polyphemus TaxID=6850 RepID=A0ABM1T9X0_LIMPO|nr:Hermansky-Pudlak syndrome 3 protein-like [Limulus polyphemus]XP_022252674.1 Hermansky-Pudlak syndrome 3 protein-like [Limulus polyphemus]XP_022252675.1 Hermansky-Pudlak syndrome 3 protein-like [Limulus polyphemus]XP_022252676.1 Hermansky-Pudlak syndrome 3 protein-like [Limulus polyphemus]
MKPTEERVGVFAGMVRVISCHHFDSQDVFMSEHEPLALCAAQEKLLVATVQHSVEVRDLNLRGRLLHVFPTVDQVKQLIYCDAGNYVATLEKKSNRWSKTLTYVRIYLNWWTDMKGQPLRVRIAGCVTPSTHSGSGHLEMIELPLNGHATCIACCKRTGTLAVGLYKLVRIYSFRPKVHDVSKLKFSDFDLLMDLEINFAPKEVAICEDIIAAMSPSQVQVLKVLLDKDEQSYQLEHTSQEVPDFHADLYETDQTDEPDITVDENFVEWHFDSCDSSSLTSREYENKLKTVIHFNSFPITIKFQSIEMANSSEESYLKIEEIKGPSKNTLGCPVKVNLNSKLEHWNFSNITKSEVITLLYRHFAHVEEHGGLSALHLLPFYGAAKETNFKIDPLTEAMTSEERPLSSVHNPLRSNFCGQIKSMCCFFTGPQEGFLYDITDKTQLVCQYPYTAYVKSVAVETELLHVLTETGLETYTFRLTHTAVLHNEVLDGLTNVAPQIEEAVCLLGLRPFLSVDQLIMSDSHLVVVSSPDDSLSSTDSIENGGFTLYSLKKPSPCQLYGDLLDMGHCNKISSPPTYLHLLSEAHMILRAQLLLYGEQGCCAKTISLYRTSCGLMGDHFICLENQRDLKTGVAYYMMSQWSIETVTLRIMDLYSQKKSSQIMQGLLLFLNYKLLTKMSDDSQEISQLVADVIVDIFAENDPEKLGYIILLSKMVTYKTEKAILILKKRLTHKKSHSGLNTGAIDTLAICLLFLREGNAEAAQKMLLSLGKEDMITATTKVHQVIVSNSSLTPLGQLIKQIRPEVFSEFLLCLVRQKTITPEEAVAILQSEAPGREFYQVPLLRDFLESFLSERKISPDSHSENEDLVILLARVYLRRLTQMSSSSHHTSGTSGMSKSSSIFGTRQMWLKEMPPFNGLSVSRTCTAHHRGGMQQEIEEQCLCWSCNQYLLRLQSLLCSPYNTSKVKTQLHDVIEKLTLSVRGRLSLKVLCSEMEEALLLLIQQCPKPLLLYARDNIGDNPDEWCKLYRTVDKILKEIPRRKDIIEAHEGVIAHLAELLSPKSFLQLLPDDGATVYLPHVKRCLEKQKASELKEKIVGLGIEISEML